MNEVCSPHVFASRRINCGEVSLHVATIGKGPPVVFLHGFPEYWRAFAPMMEALSSTFECIAPDQRGYGLSDRPLDFVAYGVDFLADDIADLICALGHSQVDIVAHDWGGLVAWHFGSRHPQMLRRMVTFNAPHPYCLQIALDQDTGQRAASSYAAVFAIEGAYKAMLAKEQGEVWDAFFGHDTQKGLLTPQDKVAQIKMWEKPGAWEAMLNWYRAANFDYRGDAGTQRAAPTPIAAPTLLVWGEQDPLFVPAVLDGLSTVAPNCDVHRIANGGHSVFREDLAGCAVLVAAFLAAEPNNDR